MIAEFLDYSKPPPGYGTQKARPGYSYAAAWSHYKERHDPPGVGAVQPAEGVWRIGSTTWTDWERRWDTQADARAAAWAWYERRLALYAFCTTQFGSMLADDAFAQILAWSDESVAAWERAAKVVQPCA